MTLSRPTLCAAVTCLVATAAAAQAPIASHGQQKETRSGSITRS